MYFSDSLRKILFQSPLPSGERPNRQHFVINSRCYFNPRSPAGSDTGQDLQNIVADDISIPAPQRGATVCERSVIFSGIDFNPRSPAGSD